jgi:hypothetical protein
MSIQPIRDIQGRIVIRGAVAGHEIWEAEMAVLLLLKLEQFERSVPVDDPPPHWNPIMPTQNERHPAPGAPDPSAESAETMEPPSNTPSVHMLQVAVPVQEALELGWVLYETAFRILHPEAPSHPM